MVKRLILIFLLLLLLPLVSTQPPFVEEGGSNFVEGYFIEFTPLGVYENNEHILFNAHVFNISNGVRIDNLTAACNFHLFDNRGEHIINQVNLSYDSVGLDWEYNATGGNFTRNGQYSYLIVCQDSADNLGGFVTVGFEITSTGFHLDTPKAIIYSSFFILFIFLFIVTIFGINMLPSSNTKDEDGKILSISYLKYFRSVLWFFEWILLLGIMFMASNIGFAYLGETLFANVFFNIYRIMFAITPVIVIVWVLWFFVQFFHDKQFQRMLNRGMFPQGKL